MENPYKDPPKRCVLCGINVDYKNVQVSKNCCPWMSVTALVFLNSRKCKVIKK